MGTISTTQISNGQAGDATAVDNNFDTIVNEFNGNIENSNVKSNAAIAVSKLDLTSGGTAWTSWSISWTNLTVGNGVTNATYQRVGRYIAFRASLVFGTTTSIAGSVSLSLPATVVDHGGVGLHPLGVCILFDTSAGNQYDGVIKYNTTSLAVIKAKSVSGANVLVNTDLSSTAPFTWATGDEIHVHGFVEAAS